MSEAAPPAGPPPPSGLLPLPPNIGAIAAPQLIGSLLNFLLYGVLAVQVYIYRLSFPKDNNLIKLLVYFTLVFESVQTALNGVDMYHWFAKGFGNVLNFADPRLSPFYTPMMGSIMALVVQLFFCYRIWVINRSFWWWCLLIAAVSVVQAVAGFIGGVKVFAYYNLFPIACSDSGQAHLTSDVAKRHNQSSLVYLWLVGDAVADVMIAATMTFSLLRASPKAHRQTNDVVSRIVRLTVETNALSAGVAIISLVLFAGTPGTTYFITPTLILGKLYANTLLVTFNNRAFLQKSAGGPSSSYVSSGNYASHPSTRVSIYRSNIPFSAGLKFEDPTDTIIDGRGVTITNHTHTIGDTDIGLDTMNRDKPLPGHL
ncbi:hypothetical protein D9615_001588 [Tricholomella constricta]|uniref:DUF6534 domain-containing protein n=1 Tax=Tricholomella constricta TaxID=117010 RepID=A0A8H5MAB8_9AGAR|nr:hypothetical protein D9615_001588 [Tricholomella constricta]